MAKLTTSTTLPLLLALTTTSLGQGFGGYGGGGYPSSNSNGDGDNGGNTGSPYSSNGNPGQDFSFADLDLSRYTVLITAHAVLATLAFGLLLPLGGILIRLASFRGLWLVHGGLQIFASVLYIAAFGLGIWTTSQSPRHNLLSSSAHPILGIALLVLLLLFQPALGLLHHAAFQKNGGRRGLASHAHVWIGRVVITLGIINGGLGLRWARGSPVAPPGRGAVVGYSVGAGVMWVLYVVAVVVGERRRGRKAKSVAGETTPSVDEGEGHMPVKERYA